MKIEKTYTTDNIINHIAGTCDVTKKTAGMMLSELTSLIHQHVESLIDFNLPNVAKFKVSEKPATQERQGRNPATGEPMTISAKPAHKVVKPKVAKALNDLLLNQ